MTQSQANHADAAFRYQRMRDRWILKARVCKLNRMVVECSICVNEARQHNKAAIRHRKLAKCTSQN